MTHSIGEIEWDESDREHIVGRLVVLPEHGGRVRYELHVYAPERSMSTVWCQAFYAFGGFEAQDGASFREESIESAKAALARQVELEWR